MKKIRKFFSEWYYAFFGLMACFVYWDSILLPFIVALYLIAWEIYKFRISYEKEKRLKEKELELKVFNKIHKEKKKVAKQLTKDMNDSGDHGCKQCILFKLYE